MSQPPTLPSFEPPYQWAAIDDAVATLGGAIVHGLLDPTVLEAVNAGFDAYLNTHVGAGAAATGSGNYDAFLGHDTIRLHGVIHKVPSTAALIGDPGLVDWANRTVGGRAESLLLNAAEFIQIQPGESAQYPHRDSDSWPEVSLGAEPVIVNAIIALDDCTLDNGATYVAPGSWAWEPGRTPLPDEWARAVMGAGDALLFRGDLIHRGGENNTRARRRVLSVAYVAGWLRPVENSFLTIPRETAAGLSPTVQALLGYRAHDSGYKLGGMVGLYENGDPSHALHIGEI